MDLTRDGNERAFEAIVQRYRRPLLRYCSRLLPPTRAEDAVQQAFLSAHRAIHAGDAELNLRPWLYRIAHNAALNLLRQQGFDHEQVSEEIDGVETPPQAFERGERLRVVIAAVQELPERQRNAIVLQAVEGRSYDEIAAELGVSDGAVRQLLNRARNTLREAAAAVTPTGFLARLGTTGGGDGSLAERVTQVVAGAGGGAVVAKAGATLMVAGAVTGGAVTGTLPGTGHRPAQAREARAADVAASPLQGSSAPGGHRVGVVLTNLGGSGGSARALVGQHEGGGPGSRQGGTHTGPSGGLGNSSNHSGPSGTSGSEDSGGGDHSGSGDAGRSGTSGDGGGSSGPSGSSSPDESDHSGHGRGSSTPDSSGPSPDSSPDDTPTAVAPMAPTSGSSGSGHSGSGKGSSPEPAEPPDGDKSGPG